jgi:hypothetical protein
MRTALRSTTQWIDRFDAIEAIRWLNMRLIAMKGVRQLQLARLGITSA